MRPFSRLALAALSLGMVLPLAAIPEAPQPTFRIAVIPKGTTHEYWKAIEAGAEKAKIDLRSGGIHVEILWKGPLVEDDREQQIQVVENFIAEKVSAIVIAPLDSKALAAPVEEAIMARIPVVVIDSALQTRIFCAYISTDNRKGGQVAARRLGELLGGKGRVIVLRYAVGSASTEEREAGFLDTMKKEFPQIVVLSSDQYGGATRETAYRAAQTLLNQFGDRTDGIFTPNESTSSGMLLALREAGLAGKVRFVGFDANEQLIAALRQRDIQGLVVQNPFMMGYYGVMTAVGAIHLEEIAPITDTGVILATPDNMDTPKVSEQLHPPLDKYLKGP